MNKTISSFISGCAIMAAILKIKFLHKRIPLYCEWEVTSHCNMRCENCSTYVDNRNATDDMSTEEAVDLVHQLADAGTKMIHMSGGEPTLRNDLGELITAAHTRNIFVFVTTNGSASKATLKKILHADGIRISIDGTEAFHDAVRNTSGAFNRAVESLEYLLGNGVKPIITTVYRPNTSYEMLEELSCIAKKKNIQIAINVMGRNINDTAGNKPPDLTGPFFINYKEILKKLKNKYGRVIASPEPLLTIINRGGLNLFGCRAMDIAVSIKADGSISLPCTGLTLCCMKGNLKEIYFGAEARHMQDLQGTHPSCSGCYIKCMCSASALLNLKGLTAITGTYVRNLFYI